MSLAALFSVISFEPCPELDARCVEQRDQSWAEIDRGGWEQLPLPGVPLWTPPRAGFVVTEDDRWLHEVATFAHSVDYEVLAANRDARTVRP
jgi:hypothetical protein